MAIHHQKSTNFLGLAHQDYLAARLLIRQGYLSSGVVLAATAVEKHLKAILSLKNLHPKKQHLDGAVLNLIRINYPDLHDNLDLDFIKFLKRSFKLRYATAESPGFGIVINQYRVLMALDSTIATIDEGFSIKKNGQEIDTPLRGAIANDDRRVTDDNIAVDSKIFRDLVSRSNKIHEMKVGKDLQTLVVEYETDGVQIEGSLCKKTDIGFGKNQWQLTKG
ncbi:MAG: hypothetical protein CMI01_06730 [Oceanospirillaceae bacterium]|nr:hypothetical protein [Oceanospirillaceae bacterium]